MTYTARSLHVTLMTPFNSSGAVATDELVGMAKRISQADSVIPMTSIVNAEAGEISSPLMRDPMPAPAEAEARRLNQLLTAASLPVRTDAEISAQFGKRVRVG